MHAILRFHMRKRFLPALCCLFLSACGNTDIRFKVLIGATTVPAAGAHPIDDSVIVVSGKKIRSVGVRKDVPIPQNSDRIDLTGKWIVPVPGSLIGPEEAASVLVLNHAPNGVVPANPVDVEARLTNGEWNTSH